MRVFAVSTENGGGLKVYAERVQTDDAPSKISTVYFFVGLYRSGKICFIPVFLPNRAFPSFCATGRRGFSRLKRTRLTRFAYLVLPSLLISFRVRVHPAGFLLALASTNRSRRMQIRSRIFFNRSITKTGERKYSVGPRETELEKRNATQ